MWCAIGQTNNGVLYIFTDVRANSSKELAETTPKELIVIEEKNAQIIHNPNGEKVRIENVDSTTKISLCGYDFALDSFMVESHNMPEDFPEQVKVRLLVPLQAQ